MASEAKAMVGAGRIGRATLWSVGNAAAGQILSLLVFFVTARLISPDAFGLAAVAILSVEMVKRILIEPFAISLLSLPDPQQEDFDACFSMILALSLTGVAVIVAAAPVAAWLMGDPRFATVLQLIAGLLLTTSLARTHEVWFSKRFEFRLLAIRSLVAAAVGGAVGIGMAVNGFGVWSLVAQQLVAGITALALLWAGSSWRPRAHFNLRLAIRRLPSVRQFVMSNILNFPANEADLFVVTSFLGPAAGGLYSAAKRITLAASMIATYSTQNVAIVAFATGARSAEAGAAFLRSLGLAALLLVPVFVGLSLLSHDVIRTLVGHRWVDAGPILTLLALVALCQALAQFTSAYLIAAQANKARTIIIGLTAAAMVTILPALAAIGTHAVAAGVLTIAGTSLAIYLMSAMRVSGHSAVEPFRVLLVPGLAGLGMAAVGILLEGRVPPLVGMLLGPPVLLAGYLTTLALIHPASIRQLRTSSAR